MGESKNESNDQQTGFDSDLDRPLGFGIGNATQNLSQEQQIPALYTYRGGHGDLFTGHKGKALTDEFPHGASHFATGVRGIARRDLDNRRFWTIRPSCHHRWTC